MPNNHINPALQARSVEYKRTHCQHKRISRIRHLQCGDGGYYEIGRFNVKYHCDDCGGDFVQKARPACCTWCHQEMVRPGEASKDMIIAKQDILLAQVRQNRHKGTIGRIKNIKNLKQALQRPIGKAWFRIYEKEATDIAKVKRREDAKKYEKERGRSGKCEISFGQNKTQMLL